MSLTDAYQAASVAGATATVLAALAGALWWLYRRGSRGGGIKDSVDRATGAIERNTEVTDKLRQEFTAHRARTDTILEEHSRMLVQHDKRLTGGGL